MQWHELALKQINQEMLHEERKKLPCYNESVGSNIMLWSNYFCSFVIMQVDLLIICVGQR